MAGLEGRLGGLIADVRNLADRVKSFAEQLDEDHDLLNPLPERIAQLTQRIAAAEKAIEDAKAAALDEVEALKKKLEEGVNKRGERAFHVVMALLGVFTSLLTAFLMVKFGLAGGGSSAGHGH